MLLLVCAGLFVQSGRKAGAIDFGFRTDGLLVLSVDPLGQGYDREQAQAFYRDILEDVVALPGVESASWARRAPLSPGPNRGNVFTLDGGTAPEPDAVRVSLNYVDSGFVDTVDIPVLRGRGFREEDTAGDRRVALVSERAARQLWPGQDAIGRRIVHGFIGGAPFEVIGVVRDAHMSPTSPFDRPPFVLYPFGFRPPRGRTTLHVHTEEPPSAALPAVADTIRRHDPTLATPGRRRHERRAALEAHAGDCTFGRRADGVSFGLLGLLLAAVGLYGVVSHAVAQRKQEFGIRSALGATSAAIIRLALGRGVVLSILELALGALAASGLARLTAGFLVGVNAGDPAVFGVAGLLLAGVTLLACLVPSRRAARPTRS